MTNDELLAALRDAGVTIEDFRELTAALRGAVTNPESVTVDNFHGDISVNYLPDGTVRHWGWLLRHDQNTPARVIAYDIGPLHASHELRNVSRILNVLADWLDEQQEVNP